MAVEIDGKIYRNLPEQVEENANNIQTILDTIASMGNIMRYKGSVATYDDLPTEDNQIGDVYNVIDTGNNYAWDGEAWDEIGSSIDLSGYPEKAQDEEITGQWTFSSGIRFDYENATGKWGIKQDRANQLSIYQDATQTFCFQGGQLFSLTNADLGNNNRKWKDIYLNGEIKWGTQTVSSTGGDANIQIKPVYDLITYCPTVRPFSNNATDLGTSTHGYKNLYLTGAIIATNTSTNITWGFSSNQYQNMQFERNSVGMFNMSSSAFFPNSNNARDLGTNSLRFRDAYINRNISDGTNSVTVEDLANLIAYAKAQGWIS